MVVQASLFETLDCFWWFLVSNLWQSLQYMYITSPSRKTSLVYAASHLPLYPVLCLALSKCFPLVISNAGRAHCTRLTLLVNILICASEVLCASKVVHASKLVCALMLVCASTLVCESTVLNQALTVLAHASMVLARASTGLARASTDLASPSTVLACASTSLTRTSTSLTCASRVLAHISVVV